MRKKGHRAKLIMRREKQVHRTAPTKDTRTASSDDKSFLIPVFRSGEHQPLLVGAQASLLFTNLKTLLG